jgi:hypothetical protein
VSIIHDALRRKERIPDGGASGGRLNGASPAGSPGSSGPDGIGAAVEARIAHFYPAIIGGGGVILAALITYLLSRPGEITVVVAPPPGTASAQAPATAAALTATAGGSAALDAANAGYQYQPWQPGAAVNPLMAQPAPSAPVAPMMPGAPPLAATTLPPAGPDASIPYADPEPSFRNIPVYHGATLTNPQAPAAPQSPARSAATTSPSPPLSDLPPDAVTIEMSQADLASQTGGVTVNGSPSQPGAKLRVGSEIRTGQSGAATVNFSRASVDLSQGSAARISRLERRVSTTGAEEEEVTLHLNEGSAHAVVQPGNGSVLVSTPALTAATQSGAFTVSTHDDGSVSVRSEGGAVRLVPTGRQNESYILRANESVVYRDGQWVKQ